MKIKIWYYNFWPNFKLLERSFIQYLSNNGYEFELDETNPDIIFFNSFGEINYTRNAIKIGYITEDLNRFSGIYKKIQENYFDLVIGNLPPLTDSKFCKHPLYINSGNYNEPNNSINEMNENVKNKNISELKFCNLIASHDNYNNRLPIFNKLKEISFIECPGKLNNNIESFDLKGITKREYMKDFLFTICPENNYGHEGYTSEKILDAAMTGCIPIYFGRTNDYQDSEIFNQDRIIRYDPLDNNSMNKSFELINDLMNNKDKLKEFYKQPIFNKNASNVINTLLVDLKNKFDNLVNTKLNKPTNKIDINNFKFNVNSNDSIRYV